MMLRWTRFVVAHPRSVLVVWLVLVLLGGYGTANVGKLLTNRFSVPGSESERGFRAPANKTVLLLANGFMARRGLRQARTAGRA